MPLGSAAIVSLGQASSGRSHGRSSSAGSVSADVIESEPVIEVQRSPGSGGAGTAMPAGPWRPDRHRVFSECAQATPSASC